MNETAIISYMVGVIQVPVGHNIIGTCGNCGGPIISPQMWAGSGPFPEWCYSCGAKPKGVIAASWGPLREMEASHE